MMYTQLTDRENKLTAARKQIKYCMPLNMFFDLWFSCENCYNKTNYIKFYGPLGMCVGVCMCVCVCGGGCGKWEGHCPHCPQGQRLLRGTFSSLQCRACIGALQREQSNSQLFLIPGVARAANEGMNTYWNRSIAANNTELFMIFFMSCH